MRSWTVEDALETEVDGVEAARVRLVGGALSVTTGEGPARLVIRDVERAPVEVRLEGGELRVTHGRDPDKRGWFGFSFSIGSGDLPSATVELIVPAATRLDAATVSADVVAAGLTEPVSLRSVSGDVTVTDLAERAVIKTVSGDIESSRIAGDLKVGTVSGDLTLVEGSSAWVEAKSVSGTSSSTSI